jgi:hypothetical protein
MNKIILFLVCASLFGISCQRIYFDFDIDCDYCFYDKIDSTDLILQLTTENVDSIYIEVYTDNYESGDLNC